MTLNLKRLTAFLLVLVLCFGMMPTALAAEVDETTAAEPEESTTAPPEDDSAVELSAESIPAESIPDDAAGDESDVTEESEGSSKNTEPALTVISPDDRTATIAGSELIGMPQDFCNLFLLDEITISGDGFNSSREHIPLYAMHMTEQPGYETNFYVAYCIEPGVIVNYGTSYGGNSYIYDDLTDVDGILNRLTAAKVKAIGVALLYGQKDIARRADEEPVRLEKLRHHAATQVIIWEIACGWRSATPPYTRTNSTLYDAINCELEIACPVWDTKFMIDGIADAYNEIVSQMEKHYVIPSFASDELSFAKTYTMTTNSAGQQTITLTDTNNILSEYSFKNTDNIKYSVSGNKLTITVTGNVSWPLTISPAKTIPNLIEQVFFVWENGDDQKMISSFSEPATDPVPCYFKLTASTTNLSLTKTTEDGNNLAGWQFSIYSDQNCTKLISGPHETDSNGKLAVSNLSVGTVWVKEIGHKDAAINALYKCDSTNPQQVTLTAGKTATVSFYNKLNTGKAKIVKTATNGGTVAGWTFTVKDANGKTVGTYTTDATGTIVVDLKPGTYTVTESDKGDAYWYCDTSPQTVTVKAGQTATVTFENQWIGKAKIVKNTTNGGTVEGWTFTVKDNSGNAVGTYTTDTTGTIVVDLDPGTYTVIESDNGDPYWHCDTTPKTVTVKAGETATVTFENEWIGKAKIVKTATNGGTVVGWTFTVKDSSGNTVGAYTTDSTGTIVVDLDPGTYTVIESDNGAPYWYCDTAPQTVTVKAGETAAVTYKNEWIGKAKIIKTLDNPEVGSVEGWTFTITDASGKEIGTYATDSEGTILVDLKPGIYTVTEVLQKDSLWQCTSKNPQTITVTAGQTAEVSFSNALRPGEIRIQKVDTRGEPLVGVEFLLEWSTDGINWSSVTHTDAAVPQIGGCTTEGLANGKLVSDTDGLVTFSGLYPTLQYRLTETATRDGYQLLTDYAYVGGLSVENDLTVTLKVVNTEIFTMPKTGSNSPVMMLIALALCLGVCIGAIVYLRKKED